MYSSAPATIARRVGSDTSAAAAAAATNSYSSMAVKRCFQRHSSILLCYIPNAKRHFQLCTAIVRVQIALSAAILRRRRAKLRRAAPHWTVCCLICAACLIKKIGKLDIWVFRKTKTRNLFKYDSDDHNSNGLFCQ